MFFELYVCIPTEDGGNEEKIAFDKMKTQVKNTTTGRVQTSNLNTFKTNEALTHFNKHGTEVMNALGKSSYNLKQYIIDSNHVIQTGKYVPEMNGFVKLIGGKGSKAKFAFVGLG